MNFSNTIRQYWAALRALLVFTVICGFGYPLIIWLDPHRRRQADWQQADRPVVYRLLRQPTAAVLSEPAIGGGQQRI